MPRVLLAAALTAALLLGLVASTALADHESVTEFHTYTDAITLSSKGRTSTYAVTGVITDMDPLPHPVTVTAPPPTTTAEPPPTTTTDPPPPTGDEPPSGPVVRIEDSTTNPAAGDNSGCTISRGSLGDVFTGTSSAPRCTWLDLNFVQPATRYAFDVLLRFDARATEGTDWEHELMLRSHGSPLANANCASGGNAETLPLRLWVNRTPSPDVWMLDIRGGSSFWLADQTINVLTIGPVVVGQTTKLAFDLTMHPEHGQIRVWVNDTLAYKNLDRPLGFRHDCNRSYDISGYAFRMQHGVYRGGSGAYQFSSSGFRFYTPAA